MSSPAHKTDSREYSSIYKTIAALHRKKHPKASDAEVHTVADEIARETLQFKAQAGPSQQLYTKALRQSVVAALSPKDARQMINLELGLAANHMKRVSTSPPSNRRVTDAALDAIQEIDDPRCWQCGQMLQVVNKCQGCFKAVYCNKECQRGNWKTHKPVCKLSSQKT